MPERKFGTGTGLSMKVYPELGLINRECSGDCVHCSSNPAVDWTPAEIKEIVQRREKPGIEKFQYSSGPKRCLICHFEWIAKPGDWKPVNDYGVPGQRLQCPQCGSMNVVGADSAEPPRIEVVFPSSNRTPEEELERTRRLTHPEPEFKSTVGDLSVMTAHKNSPERVRQQLRTMRGGHSIGDLSVVTAAHDSIENELQRNRAEKAGLTVGDLFTGRRSVIRPPISESQKLLEKKYEADAKAKDMRFLVENPSELEKRAAEIGPKIRATLAEAEKRREEARQEEAWRDVENRLRAKGIKI